jgi:hypothetical protein
MMAVTEVVRLLGRLVQHRRLGGVELQPSAPSAYSGLRLSVSGFAAVVSRQWSYSLSQVRGDRFSKSCQSFVGVTV